MNFACDFCGSMQVRYRFPNPEINTRFFRTNIPAGYFLACIDCTIAVEDEDYNRLVHKALRLPQYAEFKDTFAKESEDEKSHFFQQELIWIYRQLSKKREPF